MVNKYRELDREVYKGEFEALLKVAKSKIKKSEGEVYLKAGFQLFEIAHLSCVSQGGKGKWERLKIIAEAIKPRERKVSATHKLDTIENVYKKIKEEFRQTDTYRQFEKRREKDKEKNRKKTSKQIERLLENRRKNRKNL